MEARTATEAAVSAAAAAAAAISAAEAAAATTTSPAATIITAVASPAATAVKGQERCGEEDEASITHESIEIGTRRKKPN